MSARRVMVTGATGFIGRRALQGLIELGFEVHCLSRGADAAGADVRWHRADLRAHAEIARLLDDIRPTHLLHLAWETAHGSYYTTPDNVRWVVDSLHLVDAFIRSGGRRFVGAGTAAEYDLTMSTDLSEETSPVRPNGLYGECKDALWRVVRRCAAQAGVGHAWGRIFFCYGPGEEPSRMVPTLIARSLRGEAIPFQEGHSVRDYVYVDDVADAFVRLTDAEMDGAVNVGSGEGVRLRDMVERIATASGRPGSVSFGALPTPAYEPARVVADMTRAREELGWRPRSSLDQGIRQTVEWWRDRIASRHLATTRASPGS